MCLHYLKSHHGRRVLHCRSYRLWISLPGYWQRQTHSLTRHTLHYGEQWHQQVGGLPGYLERGPAVQLNTRRGKKKNKLQISFLIIVFCCCFSQSADTLRHAEHLRHRHTVSALNWWCDVTGFRNSADLLLTWMCFSFFKLLMWLNVLLSLKQIWFLRGGMHFVKCCICLEKE